MVQINHLVYGLIVNQTADLANINNYVTSARMSMDVHDRGVQQRNSVRYSIFIQIII